MAVLMPGTWAASAGDLFRTCLPQMLKWAEREQSHQEMNSRVLLPRACLSKTPRPLLPCSCPSGSWQPAASSQPMPCTHGKQGPQLGPAHTPGTPVSAVRSDYCCFLVRGCSVGQGGLGVCPFQLGNTSTAASACFSPRC